MVRMLLLLQLLLLLLLLLLLQTVDLSPLLTTPRSLQGGKRGGPSAARARRSHAASQTQHRDNPPRPPHTHIHTHCDGLASVIAVPVNRTQPSRVVSLALNRAAVPRSRGEPHTAAAPHRRLRKQFNDVAFPFPDQATSLPRLQTI